MLQNWKTAQQVVAPPVVQPNAGGTITDGQGNVIASSTGLHTASVVAFAPAGALNLTVGTSGTTLVNVNVVSFQLTQPANILTWAEGGVLRTDANAGSFQCSVALQLDGQYNSGSAYGDLSGDLLPIQIPAALNNSTFTCPYYTQIIWRNVPAGSHTLALTAQSNGANGVFNVSGSPELITLGGAVGG